MFSSINLQNSAVYMYMSIPCEAMETKCKNFFLLWNFFPYVYLTLSIQQSQHL